MILLKYIYTQHTKYSRKRTKTVRR